MSWPLDQPKPIPWRERARLRQEAIKQHGGQPTPLPALPYAPINLARMWCGAIAGEVGAARLYYLHDNPPDTEGQEEKPNIVWSNTD